MEKSLDENQVFLRKEFFCFLKFVFLDYLNVFSSFFIYSLKPKN